MTKKQYVTTGRLPTCRQRPSLRTVPLSPRRQVYLWQGKNNITLHPFVIDYVITSVSVFALGPTSSSTLVPALLISSLLLFTMRRRKPSPRRRLIHIVLGRNSVGSQNATTSWHLRRPFGKSMPNRLLPLRKRRVTVSYVILHHHLKLICQRGASSTGNILIVCCLHLNFPHSPSFPCRILQPFWNSSSIYIYLSRGTSASVFRRHGILVSYGILVS